MDPEYLPSSDNLYHKKRNSASKSPHQNARKQTTLQQVWPTVKKMAQDGKQPKEIAKTVNKQLPKRSHLTNKQISDLITRKKKESKLPLNVTKTAGGLKAVSSDCMLSLLNRAHD